ncbi:hypothetical protein NDN08_001617 [Rhodosorus marinus]|uniref:Uncharacterized protein n=1 Tax=Rhodosorus marinus TaxID=101924 RepID=A0AAV8UVK9_9RHOD|nr:hypothetical protein NDN08_001617 [Rhodosorus marinus]
MIGFVSSGSGCVRSKGRSEVCQVRSHNRLRKSGVVLRMASSEGENDSSDEGEKTFPLLKDFLAGLNDLGHLRIIVKNDAAVSEAIAKTEKLFYATIPSGLEYANIIDPSINLDLHMKLAGYGGARFEKGISRGANKAPTYIIRMLGTDKETVMVSFFLSGPEGPGDITPERVEAWTKLKDTFAGSEDETCWF